MSPGENFFRENSAENICAEYWAEFVCEASMLVNACQAFEHACLANKLRPVLRPQTQSTGLSDKLSQTALGKFGKFASW